MNSASGSPDVSLQTGGGLDVDSDGKNVKDGKKRESSDGSEGECVNNLCSTTESRCSLCYKMRPMSR